MVFDQTSRDFKIFPEQIVLTASQTTLAEGTTDLFRLHSLGKKDKIFRPLNYAFEDAGVDGIDITPIIDNERKRILRTRQLPGIGTDWSVFGNAHPLEIATDEFILEASNGQGAAEIDFRSRVTGILDAFDTATKVSLMQSKRSGIRLSTRDKEAVDILNRRVEQGKEPIDFGEAVALGISIPQNFNDFLAIHEVLGTIQVSFPDATNLAVGVRSELANIDVEFRGDRALVLESIYLERPTQAELGEVRFFVSRDNDDDLLTLDPADLRADVGRTDLHIHAFQNMTLEMDLLGGVHNNYKASAIMTLRKIGIGLKAKMVEFIGTGIPVELEMSTEEKAISDRLNLQEVARTGLIAIG